MKRKPVNLNLYSALTSKEKEVNKKPLFDGLKSTVGYISFLNIDAHRD